MKFNNTYISLGMKFYQRVLPKKIPAPKLLLWNNDLADNLGIDDKLQNDQGLLSQYFSGNELPEGAESIALAYSGHQFGHFNPQLGDGRAHLLGEIVDQNNVRRDIQLKGSGQTTFSRRGDGKCALAPALREYIMSEAMFALGVPTSRCLAVVSTGEVINRGLAKAGAVVTRVANSHIRVGTFQYFAVRGDTASLKSLLDYSIERHFPEINKPEINKSEINESEINTPVFSQQQRILQFLESAINKQITLIIQWLRVGFIHGVMNTDNTVICGETIDFGPCAMMGKYDEKAVFSSIDEYGRYAFGNQGDIAQWNMARLADCLLSLLVECNHDFNDESSKKEHEQQALEKIEAIVHQYKGKFDTAYYAMYSNKIGLHVTGVNVSSSTNKAVVDDLLSIMQNQGLDYTKTFHRLTQSLTNLSLANELKIELGEWYQVWLLALEKNILEELELEKPVTSAEVNKLAKAQVLMKQNNPVVIPRNHHVELILARCEAVMVDEAQHMTVDSTINVIVGDFLRVLRSPYHEIDSTKNYQDVPEDADKYYQTFCGT
ncbi:MAG: hypothetical protein COB83_02140 [Gammaproteobacteria bacterium]|nr:MAG: hypothetical protein COB83_02140 [Gammaproteobacteria bacterium]